MVEHGPVLGLAGSTSSIGTLRVERSETGHVVRSIQHIDGLPVYGGEVVASLDAAQDLLSLSAETASPPAAVEFSTPRPVAQGIAVATVGDAYQLPRRLLEASVGRRWLYDPALVGESPVPAGTRPVWRFSVTGPGVRDTVLVDAVRGGVALRVSEMAELSRRICDRANQPSGANLPGCTATLAARSETTGETGQAEVDAAFTNIGRASDLYAAVGRDLGETIGSGATGAKVIEAWVRWCTIDEPCPMDNAFWDGFRMVLGDGYAAADDVIAHELTHGVVDRTSRLVYLHQSGAINESLADIMGEIADQRSQEPGEDDSAWLLGEETPAGALRSLADPTLFGQPDRITSALYGTGDAEQDSGEVHHNSGIGNKAAYLISQGGTFNGVAVTGIDAGDPTLAKTATLYHEAMVRLTSGAEYDDLARTLAATCAELAATGVGGFTSADCASVDAAIQATELLQQPASAAAREISDQCPAGQVKTPLFSDADGISNSWTRAGTGYDYSGVNRFLWTAAPNQFGAPDYAHSGSWSWFGVDPDPYRYGDSPVLTMRTTNGVAVPAEGTTYLHFHHAYLLEWYPPTESSPARYYDGAEVNVFRRNPDNTLSLDQTPLEWANGPDKQIGTLNPWTGFGGDSHGWGSSRLDLTALGGTTVHPQWRISANHSTGFLGWYVDDIEIYNCRAAAPTAVRGAIAVGTRTGAKLTWTEPDWAGTGITGYRVTRSTDGRVTHYPAEARSATFATLPTGTVTKFRIAPLDNSGEPGPPATVQVARTQLALTTSRTQVEKFGVVRVKAGLSRAATGAPIAGQTVTIQRRPVGSTQWTTWAELRTRSDGTVSAVPHMLRSYEFRARFPGGAGWMGAKSPARKITVVNY